MYATLLLLGASRWRGAVDEHVTLNDMVRFADGDVVHIDLGGRGGGGC